MKRFVIFLLVIALLLPAVASAGGLRRVQDYFANRIPFNYSDLPICLSGEIVDVYSIGVNTHWEMKVKVDDDDAYTALWSDYPYFIATFRLHLEECPFAVGDEVLIEGTLNNLYSSVIIPVIVVKYINDSDDF